MVMAIPTTTSAVGEGVPDIWHAGVRGVVLNPAKFGTGNEKVTTVAVPQVVEDRGVSSVEFGVLVHLLEDGFVLRPKVEPHLEEEQYLHLRTVSVWSRKLVDGADGHRDDPHMGVEDLEGVELEMEWTSSPLEMIPVVFVGGEVDEFLGSREVGGVIDDLLLVFLVSRKRGGGGLDFDLSKVLDDVVEDF